MTAATTAADPAGTGKAHTASTELLKGLLEGYVKTANLQNDYQSLYRSLPEVFGIAGEILKKKEAGEKELEDGLAIVEKLLAEASDKASKLSDAMQEQHAALQKMLADKVLLTEILRTGKQGQAAKSGLAGAMGQDSAAAGAQPAGGLGDPRFAYQLNMLMGNIQAMVSREVERQIATLKTQADQVMKGAK